MGSFFVAREAQIKCLYELLSPALAAVFPVQGAGQCLSPAGPALSLPGKSTASPGSCGKGLKCVG